MLTAARGSGVGTRRFSRKLVCGGHRGRESARAEETGWS